MPLILAIEPDKRQAAQLKVLVKNRLRADLILADTTELALEAIGDRIPDLVLVPALLSPEEDGALNQALRVIAHAAHVQTLTIPVFASSSAKPAPVKTGGLLSKLLPGKGEAAPEGCDPSVFGDQIAEYLAEAAANRQGRGFGDDDFEDEAPAPSNIFARVETFAPPESFEPDVEDEPARPSSEPAILREPEEPAPPARERTSVLDLFKRRERAPVEEPGESTWPGSQPQADAVEETPPAAADADNDNDWAPPADQAIGIDLPPADQDQPVYAAPEAATIEPPDPAEEAVWEEQESDEETTWAQPATKWTPGSESEPPPRRPAPEPAPADLLAEFTADLATTKLRPQKPPAAPPARTRTAPPPTPPVAARQEAPPPPPPKPKPKPQPVARAEAPPQPPTPPPVAAQAPPPPPARTPQKPAANAVFNSKKERPEWTALIDSLRQDMERMRQDRGGRAKPVEPIAAQPPVTVEPAPVHEEAPAPTRAAPAAAPSAAAPPPQDRAAAKPRPAKRPEKKPTPVQDEWGFFDPQQCGFAALLAKLDEITDNEEKPA